jgi:tetratricopeptide (TPR) repeat protein
MADSPDTFCQQLPAAVKTFLRLDVSATKDFARCGGKLHIQNSNGYFCWRIAHTITRRDHDHIILTHIYHPFSGQLSGGLNSSVRVEGLSVRMSETNEAQEEQIHKLKLSAAGAIDRDDFDDAEQIYRRLMEIYDDDDSVGLLGCLNILGRLLVLRGKNNEAIEHFEKATAITALIYGPDHIECAAAHIAMASVLRKGSSEQIEEAEESYRDALKVLKTHHGKNASNTDIASALVGLGMSLEAQGEDKYEEAETCYKDALNMRKKVCGPKSPETGDVLLCIAALLGRSREVNEAFVIFQQALDVFRTAFQTDDHPRIQLALDSLHLLYRKQAKDFYEDEQYGQSAVYEMAANFKSGGAPMVQGRFFRISEGTLGFGKTKRTMYVAMFPKQGEVSHDKTLLLWAFDEEAACRRSSDADHEDDDQAVRGAIELVTPSASIAEEGKKKSKKNDDRKWMLQVTSARSGKKGGKAKMAEVFAAYAENKETAEDWYHVLCEEADEDDEESEDEDDDDDSDS